MVNNLFLNLLKKLILTIMEKNIIGIFSIPILIFGVFLVSYLLTNLLSDFLTDFFLKINIYSKNDIFYEIGNFCFMLFFSFMLLAIVNILIYKRIYQNKIIFTISSILYSYLSINFLTVFICDYKEIPYPFWTFH